MHGRFCRRTPNPAIRLSTPRTNLHTHTLIDEFILNAAPKWARLVSMGSWEGEYFLILRCGIHSAKQGHAEKRLQTRGDRPRGRAGFSPSASGLPTYHHVCAVAVPINGTAFACLTPFVFRRGFVAAMYGNKAYCSPFNMTRHVAEESVVISKCHILHNMTFWSQMAHYRRFIAGSTHVSQIIN